MKEIENQSFEGERPLYRQRDLKLRRVYFNEGESPLKEGRNLDLDGVEFRWKYPLWCCQHVLVRNSIWHEMGRSGVWYTSDLTVTDCLIEAPKNFRRCHNIVIKNTSLLDAQETLWNCSEVALDHVDARGDYFGMNLKKGSVDHLRLCGNYCFDGASDLVIRNSIFLSKDSFWNTENVTVYDSVITGEYLGWHSKNLKLVNCTISSEQGLCYAQNLVLENCRLMDTDLAFEYSTVQASIEGAVHSVKNPEGGRIEAKSIGTLELDPEIIDPKKTEIILSEKEESEK